MHHEKIEYNGKTYTMPIFSTEGGISLRPKKKNVVRPAGSLVMDEMNTLWDISRFKLPHTPVSFGEISKEAQREFLTDKPVRVLDMPIRFPGTDYRIPAELGYIAKALQECIDVYESVHPEPARGYCYLTFDHKIIKQGILMREAPAHVDGFQGARWVPPRVVNNTITIDSCLPTVYYPQPFDFDELDVAKHDFFWEMNRQIAMVNSAFEWRAPIWNIAWMNAYCVHRGDSAPRDMERHWMRLSWEDRIFDRLGNAHNPLFDYNWEMVERDIEQLHLVAFDPTSDPSLRVFPHQDLEGKPNERGVKTQPNLKPKK